MDTSLQDQVSELQRKEQERAIEKHKQETVEHYARLFGIGERFVNVVQLAGYAMAFGIWNLMSKEFPAGMNFVVALLLSSSAIVYTGWEVWRSLSVTYVSDELNRVRDATFATWEELAEFTREQNKRVDAEYVRTNTYQPHVLRFTLATGFGAALLMSFYFLIGTIDEFTSTLYASGNR